MNDYVLTKTYELVTLSKDSFVKLEKGLAPLGNFANLTCSDNKSFYLSHITDEDGQGIGLVKLLHPVVNFTNKTVTVYLIYKTFEIINDTIDSFTLGFSVEDISSITHEDKEYDLLTLKKLSKIKIIKKQSSI